MKKILLLLILFMVQITSFAQEVATEAPPVIVDQWSHETKVAMMVVFSIVTVIVVLRTFRNKPEV